MTEAAAPPVAINVLGPLVVQRDGARVPVGRGAPSIILTTLAAHARAVTTSELVEIVQEVRGRPVTPPTIHTAIWRLRSRLGAETIDARDEGYELVRSRCEVDADRFANDVERARELTDLGQAHEAIALYEAAFGLWRGAQLGDLGTATTSAAPQRRLRELRAAGAEELASALRQDGRPRDAARVLEELLAGDQLREHAWALLVGAHADAGRPEAANAAFDRARLVLAEYGVEPGRELEAAVASIRGRARGPAGPTKRVNELPPLVAMAVRNPLVGRVSEVKAIGAAADPALAGDGATMTMLSGSAGVGKTRLAAEAAVRASAQGAVVWFEVCESEAVAPFAPLGSWIRHLVADLSATHRRDLAEGPLAPLLRSEPIRHELADVGHLRAAQYEAIAELTATAVVGPAVLVLDDIHNAPAETLGCLAHLLRTRSHLPLAIVATIRPDALSATSLAALAELRRLPTVPEPIPVPELDPSESVELLRSLLPARRSIAAVHELHDATGGNPALISALAAVPDQLSEEGAPRFQGNAHGLLVATIQAMVSALDEASAELLELVAAAALVRPVVPTRLLTLAAQHLEVDPPAIARALSAAASAGLLSADPGGTVLFRHEMVRDAVYAAIAPDRRASLHRAIARGLEAGATAGEVDVYELADHVVRAVPKIPLDEVARHAVVAAAKALSMLDLDRAVGIAQTALDLYALGADPDARTQGELLTLLAGAYAELGHVHEAVAAYRRAAEVGMDRGWIDLAAPALTHALQMRASRPRPDDVDLTRLRRLLPRAGELDEMLLAECLVYLMAADPAGSTEMVDGILAAAAANDDVELQLKVIQELTSTTPLHQRAGYHAQYASLAAQLGEPGPLARAALHRWMADIEHGRSSFDLPWEPVGRLVREADEPLLTYDWRLWRATMATNLGRWDEAGRLVESARTTRFVPRGTGTWLQQRPAYVSAIHALQLGSILWCTGELELLHAVGSQFPLDVLIRCSIDSRAMRARVGAEVGDPMAMALCDELLDEPYIDGPQTADWLASMTYLASACGRVGHRRGAELCLQLLEPYEHRHTLVSWTQYIGAVRHNLAYVYELLEDWDAAAAALERSIDEYDAMSAAPFATIARAHLVRILRARGRPRDLAEAGQLHARVVDEADAREMTGLQRSLAAT